jgi:hypothetical protein
MTTAREGVEGSASRPGRSLPMGKARYPLYRMMGGLQGRSGQVRKISSPPGFDPRTVQPVASHYTDWATWPTKFHFLSRNRLPLVATVNQINQGHDFGFYLRPYYHLIYACGFQVVSFLQASPPKSCMHFSSTSVPPDPRTLSSWNWITVRVFVEVYDHGASMTQFAPSPLCVLPPNLKYCPQRQILEYTYTSESANTTLNFTRRTNEATRSIAFVEPAN